MNSFWQEVRFSFRMFVKNPVFTLVIVVTLALGIGANTAIFSLVDAVLLKELPVREPDQLVLGMIRVIYGLSIGLLLALALTRVLASSMFGLDLLYGASANDPLTFLLVAVLLSGVTFLACYIPARRAAKVNLLVALHYE